jgi:uroporphyrinogen-III decarboxylase
VSGGSSGGGGGLDVGAAASHGLPAPRLARSTALSPCARAPTSPSRRSAAAAGVRPKALQGNLDPCELFGSHASIRASVTRMLEGFGAETPLIGECRG